MTLLEILQTKKYTTDKHTHHHYVQCFYDEAFSKYQHLNLNFLEIGVLRGDSMKLWSDYFTNPNNIVGIDLFGRCSFQSVSESLRDYNVKLHELDSINPEKNKFDEFKSLYSTGFDIIIDDGHHAAISQIKTFNNFSKLMNSGGLYIIEDIHDVDEIEKNIPGVKILRSPGEVWTNWPFGVVSF